MLINRQPLEHKKTYKKFGVAIYVLANDTVLNPDIAYEQEKYTGCWTGTPIFTFHPELANVKRVSAALPKIAVKWAKAIRGARGPLVVKVYENECFGYCEVVPHTTVSFDRKARMCRIGSTHEEFSKSIPSPVDNKILSRAKKLVRELKVAAATMKNIEASSISINYD